MKSSPIDVEIVKAEFVEKEDFDYTQPYWFDPQIHSYYYVELKIEGRHWQYKIPVESVKQHFERKNR